MKQVKQRARAMLEDAAAPQYGLGAPPEADVSGPGGGGPPAA